MSRRAKIYIIGGIIIALVLIVGGLIIYNMFSKESMLVFLVVGIGGGAMFLLSFYGNGLEGQDRILVDYQMKRLRDEMKNINPGGGEVYHVVIEDLLRRVSELEAKIGIDAPITSGYTYTPPTSDFSEPEFSSSNADENDQLWHVIELSGKVLNNFQNIEDKEKEVFIYAIKQLGLGRHRLKDTLSYLERRADGLE